MMSPMALRRTMSNRLKRGVSAARESGILVRSPIAVRTASRLSRPQPRADYFGGRVILGITHDHHSPPAGLDLVALRDTLRSVISALGMKIRMDFTNDGAHVLFRKNNDGVNVRQRRQNLRAFFGWHHGAPFTLQPTHRVIGVHRDNQLASELASSVKIAHMANVQQIETSVRQRDAIAGAAPLRRTLSKFVAGNN